MYGWQYGLTAIGFAGRLARQLYSKKIIQPNIGTYNKLTGGIILFLTSQPAVKPYYNCFDSL